jgi:hypothetical protein
MPFVPHLETNKMAISNGLGRRPSGHDRAIGLMAIGSSGPWKIDIDETTSGKARYFAQIEGPLVDLYFEIGSLTVIDEAIRFFAKDKAKNNRNGTLVLSDNKTMQVSLIRDDEFTDRYFFRIESKGETIARLTIGDADLTHVSEALNQVKEELGAE